MIKVGSDFSGVGAFNQALIRLGISYKEVFACDMDKYARQTFIHNYGEPEYYPTNVYDRQIPSEPLDIYMTSPPCQAFSLAGKRLGKEDQRGILFFNSHEFIKVNKPRYFIFENVKGLLSDDNGKTFQEWINLLGGKSVNGDPILFPYPDSVPYHLYWKVLNAKDHGVPQNRERVFLIGIRDDKDNNFRWPVEEHLTKRLKDVLEEDVDEKYFLSEKSIQHLINHKERHDDKGTGFGVEFKDEDSIATTIRANAALCPTDNHLKIKSATSKGYEEGSLILGYTRDSKGKVVSRNIWEQSGTIHSATGGGGNTDQFVLQIGTWRTHEDGKGFREIDDGNCPTIPARAREDGSGQPVIQYGYKIRRLTPRECFRLMDFPDSFTWSISDSQAYKQAGNSIVVNVLYKIIKNLNL